MRFSLMFKLEKAEIPIQYRKTIISFIKYSLMEYDEKYYRKFYNNKDNIIKNYSFSVYYKQDSIQGEEVILKDNTLNLNVTVLDYETGIILYNSFNKQRFKKYPLKNNSMELQNISMLAEKEINSDKILIKFLSPLCVRKRQNLKDYYYSYSSKKFQEVLKINIKEQIKITDIPEEFVDNFTIEPIDAKKIVVKFYEKYIECSTGKFEISGDKQLLKYLYQSGMGSKHSAGFGMFQII